MRRLLVAGSLCCAPAFVSTPALAGELGNTSSGQITITIRIPPIAAAMTASSEGAAGFWTAADATNVLMINLPATVSEAESKAELFHSPEAAITASVQVNPFVALNAGTTAQMNGMERQSFRLSRISAAGLSGPAPSSVTMTVTQI